MRHKSEVMEKFKGFGSSATNESSQKIGKLLTDNGGEYLSQEFKAYYNPKVFGCIAYAHIPDMH